MKNQRSCCRSKIVRFAVRSSLCAISYRNPVSSRDLRSLPVRVFDPVLQDAAVFLYDPRGYKMIIIARNQNPVHGQIPPDISQGSPEQLRADALFPCGYAHPVSHVSSEWQQRFCQLMPDAHFRQKFRFIHQPEISSGNPSMRKFLSFFKGRRLSMNSSAYKSKKGNSPG